MSAYLTPLIYDAQTHRPLQPNEFMTPVSLPVSAQPNNQLQILADGMYIGSSLAQTAYYVSSAGTDVPASGAKATPYKTLDYCLAQISANSPHGVFAGIVTVALQAGQTFPMTADFPCAGQVTFTFYGDTNYGDFNGVFIGTPGANPAVMTDLNRPIITPQPIVATTGIAGVRLLPNFIGIPTACALNGVQVNLPAAVSAAASNLCDFITGMLDSSPRVSLLGSIINVLDINSQAGLFGLLPRTQLAILNQFASQILIQGVQISGPTTPQTLLAREFVFKFYLDYLGNNQMTGSLTTGSPGSTVLQVNWPTVATSTVTGTKTNLATFPVVGSSGSYGLGNYFANLTRDQQSRPLNVLCASLI